MAQTTLHGCDTAVQSLTSCCQNAAQLSETEGVGSITELKRVLTCTITPFIMDAENSPRAGRVSKANMARLMLDNPRLAAEGDVWCHLTGGPEKGGLLVAKPDAPVILGDERYAQVRAQGIGAGPRACMPGYDAYPGSLRGHRAAAMPSVTALGVSPQRSADPLPCFAFPCFRLITWTLICSFLPHLPLPVTAGGAAD